MCWLFHVEKYTEDEKEVKKDDENVLAPLQLEQRMKAEQKKEKKLVLTHKSAKECLKIGERGNCYSLYVPQFFRRGSERAEKALMSALSKGENTKKKARQREIHNILF